MNRTLAIVRCGDNSLHESWAVGDRKFDIGISYFGDDLEDFPEAAFVHRGKGGKWDGISAFFRYSSRKPSTATTSSWLPDDDICASTADVNRLLELGEALGFEVFQPSLDDQSYYSRLITLKHPSFDARHTNFVEIMAPVLSRRLHGPDHSHASPDPQRLRAGLRVAGDGRRTGRRTRQGRHHRRGERAATPARSAAAAPS